MLHEPLRDTSRDAILATADRVGREVLAPNAEGVDAGSISPRVNFEALARAGLLGLTVPVRYGGLGAGQPTVLRVHETLARYCAVTAFLLTQHLGECSRIAAAQRPLSAEILPLLAEGTLIAGIGASQLRRAGEPLLRARAVEGGYVLDGEVPWASGLGLMTHIALGAVVENAGPLFFWVPFHDAPGITFGAPMDLTVMGATSTVAVRCQELFVPADRVVGDDHLGAWTVRHGGALHSPAAFQLGIGAACLAQLRRRMERVGSEEQTQRVEREALRLKELRSRYYAQVDAWLEDRSNGAVLDALLQCRVEIASLVMELAALAVAAEGGTAHLRSNPAQRHLREASFFCTVTVNPAVRQAMVLGL